MKISRFTICIVCKIFGIVYFFLKDFDCSANFAYSSRTRFDSFCLLKTNLAHGTFSLCYLILNKYVILSYK